MSLFDNTHPDFDGYRPDSMSEAKYLQRSTRPIVARVRGVLNEWFDRYPDSDKNRLKGDFLSSRPQQHHAAFFELFVHEFLVRNSWEVSVHPPIEGTSKVPDFFCTKDGISLYVEARACMGRSNEEIGAIRRLEKVVEMINRRIKTKRYYLSISTRGLPSQEMGVRRMSDQLQVWLESLDYESYLANPEIHPKKIFEEAGCEITFEAFAHPEKEVEHDRIIGFMSYDHEGGWVSPDTTIRTAIVEKANRYGDLNAPYIIAVNAPDVFTVDVCLDTVDTLYGREIMRQGLDGNGATLSFMKRLEDGEFGHPRKPRKQHVSGVLVFGHVGATHLAMRQGIYVPHVFSNKPFMPAFTDLPFLRFENDSFIRSSGKSVTDLLGLDQNWPHNESDEND